MSRKAKNKNGPITIRQWSPTANELAEMEANHIRDMQSYIDKLMLNKYGAYTSDKIIEREKRDIVIAVSRQDGKSRTHLNQVLKSCDADLEDVIDEV